MGKSRIATYLLFFLVLLALAALVYRLIPGSTLETAEVLLPESVQSEPATEMGLTPEGRVITITEDSVQTVLPMLRRADAYTRTLRSEIFWTGGSSVSTIDVSANGDLLRLNIHSSDGTKNILISGDKKWIWYDGSNTLFSGAAHDRDSDEYQNLLTYEDITELPRENIRDAGYENYENVNCLYVSYVQGNFGYLSKVWISVDTGLLMGSETYDENSGELIMRLSSSKPVIGSPDESVFKLP